MAENDEGDPSVDTAAEPVIGFDGDGRESSPLLLAASVGVPMGAVFGAAACYVLGEWDEFWNAVLLGMLVGALAGTTSIRIDQLRHNGVKRQDLATFVGIVLGLFPAGIMILKLAGELSFTLLAGTAFLGPMSGMLMGAFFDRAIDELRDRRPAVCTLFLLLGTGLCGGLVTMIERAAYGPPPDEIAVSAEDAIRESWREDPVMRSGSIEHLSLARHGRSEYRGSFELKIANVTIPHHLAVRDEGGSIFVSWEPEEE